jgi:hypothetical protein
MNRTNNLIAIEEEEKALWEKVYDFCDDHKTTIAILSLAGSIGYGYYKVDAMEKALKEDMKYRTKLLSKSMDMMEERLKENISNTACNILSVVPPMNSPGKVPKKYVDIVENNMLKNMNGLENRIMEVVENRTLDILSLIQPLAEQVNKSDLGDLVLGILSTLPNVL